MGRHLCNCNFPGFQMAHSHDHHRHAAGASDSSHLAIDPVCGMSVDPLTATLKADHAGQTYYFCSAGCRSKFISNPAKYLEPVSAVADPAAEGATYTCPMHPEIRQVGPGSCPICGMALEPELASLVPGPNPELID